MAESIEITEHINTLEIINEGSEASIEIEADIHIEIMEIIERGPRGRRGPPGDPGPPGPPSVVQGYTHQQVSPAPIWIVNHNLGYYPIILIFDSGGNEIIAQILNISINQLRIYFAISRIGTVRCL